ncbi:DUF2975 domain-containing protein [Pedobacter miscanthi]|uniref:DUF2975 domain-containing protein n=1 Tax=Pedobacter miscanthi TaxID=2259170 RepID=A0A366KQ77_9SPHI|nr:DUF2975 domain-containing protein [Pedobacter miscanthi]RBQ03274.1 hypothetical protein DRW42_22095 [Pedobacter miscanthi]
MKLSESKVIKWLNRFAGFALVLYIVILMVSIFNSGVPSAAKGIKWYTVFNVKAEEKVKNNAVSINEGLDNWFNKGFLVSETKMSSVSLRFKSYSDLFSFSAITFQLAYLFYFLCIGLLILLVKLFFKSLTKDEIFTRKNVSIIIYSSVILMLLPSIRWITQEFLINCITKLKLNDSGYVISNGASFFGTETLIGLVLLAFGLAFKVGVDIKQENEAFV